MSTLKRALSIALWLCIIHIALYTTMAEAYSAKARTYYEYKLNPSCKEPECNSDEPAKSAVNLISIESMAPNQESKTNFLWSNIGGPPMLITSVTNRSSSLVIDWPRLLHPKSTPPTNKTNDERAIHFSHAQHHTIGVLFERVFIFDDTTKNGVFTKDKPHIDLQWNELVWDSARRSIYQKDDFLRATLRLKANQRYNNGTITVKLALPNSAERQKQVPHLKLSQQSISIVLIVDGIQGPSNFKHPRLGATFVVIVQSQSGTVGYQTISESAISDEYTPGVFRIKSLQFRDKGQPSDGAKPNNNLGFLYWKEVAYTDPRKIISRTVDVFDSEYENSTGTLPDISPPFYEFFRDLNKTSNNTNADTSEPDEEIHYSLYRYQVIYGKGDSLYSPTNFVDFSFVIGLGAAPEEQMFSFLVKLVIFICFCLPILVMTLGLVFLMMKRWRETGDTELLLAAE